MRQLSAELDQEQQDRELLAALDNAWLARLDTDLVANRFVYEASIPILRVVLVRYGIRVDIGSAEQTAALIRGKPEPLRAELLAALEEWRLLARPIIGTLQRRQGRSWETWPRAVLPPTMAGCGSEIRSQCRRRPGGPVRDVRQMQLPEVSQLLRGQSGTFVRLKVAREGQGKRTAK